MALRHDVALLSPVLQFASERLRDDEEVVRYAVERRGYNIEFASDRLRNNRDIVLQAIKQNGNALEVVPSKFQDDEEIVQTALDTSGNAILYASERFKQRKDLLERALENNGEAIFKLPKSYPYYDEMVKIAIGDGEKTMDVMLLAFDKDQFNNIDVVLEAVKANPDAMEYVAFDLLEDAMFEELLNSGDRLRVASYGEQEFLDQGIPAYTEEDLYQRNELADLAMQVVRKYEIENNGYEIISSSNDTEAIPFYICKDKEQLLYIAVKADVYPDKPYLSVEEKIGILERAEKSNATAYFAPVSLMSMDYDRARASLALKHDRYYTTFSGLEKVWKRSSEWIKSTLEKIDELDLEKRKESSIRYSLRFPDKTDFERWKEELNSPTFQEMLLTCIDRKGMTNQEFYHAALLDRKLFSAIKNNPDYQPKKETAVACCFGLKLSLFDSLELLSLAGYVLSLSIPWDRVIYYCLRHEILDLDVVNELLYEEGEKCIRV